MVVGLVVLRRGKGEGEEDQAPWKMAQSPPPALPNRSPQAGEAESHERQGLGRGKGEGILSPASPIPTWALTHGKRSGAVGAAACGREHPRVLIPPSGKALCTWSSKMHKQEYAVH